MGWKKVVLIGAALGAAYYFLKKHSFTQTVEEEDGEVLDADGNPISKSYVTLDRDALKEKAGDVIDKVAPIIDDTREKISPLINAAKEKVNSLLVKPENEASEEAADAPEGEANTDAAASETEKKDAGAPEEEEFFDDEEETEATQVK